MTAGPEIAACQLRVKVIARMHMRARKMIKSARALRPRTAMRRAVESARKKRRGFVQEIGTICSCHVGNAWGIHTMGADEYRRHP